MEDTLHTLAELREKQALPLDIKIRLTRTRVRAWINEYGTDGVYISFSGGKDSTVLLDLVRNEFGYQNVRAMFVDIPTQYPELRQFVKKFDDVDIVQPQTNFFRVCEKYGFPLISKEVSNCVYGARKYLAELIKKEKGIEDNKSLSYAYYMADLIGVDRRKNKTNKQYQDLLKGNIPNYRLRRLQGTLTQKDGSPSQFNQTQYAFFLDAPFEISDKCCDVMKKAPAHMYEKATGRKPIIATMADEGRLRTQKWLQEGCNAFESDHPHSKPMSFWTEQDVLHYIKSRNLEICSVYGDVVSDDEESGQLQMFELENQKLHCTGCQRTGCVLCGFGAHIKGDERFLKLKETHPGMYSLLDKATNNGYTMRQAIEWVNENSNKHIRL